MRRRSVPRLADKKFMLLRHTAVVRMGEAGCSVLEILAVSGHSMQAATQILDRYNVKTKVAAEAAFRKRLLAENGGMLGRESSAADV